MNISKLATNDQKDKAFLLTLKFNHRGLSATCLYTCGKTWKSVEIVLKLATNWQSDKGFSVDINICPQGVICPCPGAIYMYKSI